jgi:hypothetical protein
MISNEERVQRYAKEIALACGYADPLRQHQISARAVMAVADAEHAELRAEIRRLTEERDTANEHVAYHLRDYSLNGEATGDLAVDMALYAGRMRIRAEAAERALADERAKRRAGYCGCAWCCSNNAPSVMAGGAHDICSAQKARAALAGPEPDTTKDNQ